ncbi:MAG: hydantoinase/oxoprolinase family protein [bacterium]
MNRKIKIGIDVGGTFTHAVAIDIADFSILGKACVPTTHNALEGVARGVVNSMHILIEKHDIYPDEVILIAHSTTQATNALLEGDVASVGVIGMGKGLEKNRVQKETNLNDIQLAPNKILPVKYVFLDTSLPLERSKIEESINFLLDEGADVIVASEAFSVDHPENEELVVSVAESMDIQATAACKISRLYGLRVRTRTAIINASMMPKMLETANLTEEAVRKSGINAPLMVMRSDGGIMSINEMRKRPILTMLSGPAAGVAAAMMYAKVSDGIFLEVGGTSTDISVIKNGKPQIKSAQIGGNRLYLRTLDVRTIGIAGGSIPRISGNKIIDVGPRSAHIANLTYAAYSENIKDFDDFEIEKIQPKSSDPADYMAIKTNDKNYCVTPTEASYMLDLVNEVGHGQANINAVKSCFNTLEKKLNHKANDIAKDILTISAEKIKPIIKQLTREYKLDPDLIEFLGGGGGASAIVPFTSKYLKIPYKIAENTEVISAIGAALGMIRDSIEKNMLSPTESDILQLQKEAYDSVVEMGAIPESIEVTIEIDSKNKKVIATAMGNSELRTKDLVQKILTENELLDICAKSMKEEKEKLVITGSTSHLYAVNYNGIKKILFGLIKKEIRKVRIIDKEGTIRLQINKAFTYITNKNLLKNIVTDVVDKLTTFGDAGALMPDIYVVIGPRIIDYCGLINQSQILALLDSEISKTNSDETIILLASQKE